MECVKSYLAIVTKYVESHTKAAYERVLQRFNSEKLAKEKETEKEYGEVLRLMQGQFHKIAVWRAGADEATRAFTRNICQQIRMQEHC